jgi:hypothetical protein
LWNNSASQARNSIDSSFGALNRLNSSLRTNGGIPNLAGDLVGNLNSITRPLTNVIPGSLTNLTSNLNVFGKAGTFATNFANPLGGLEKLATNVRGQATALAGQLQGQATALATNVRDQATALAGQLQGQATALAGQLEGQFTALSGQLEGALGNLGGFFSGSGDLVSGTKIAAGFNNTVNRATVDAAFARVVGSAKVPLPSFQYPSLASLSDRQDIQQAQNFLKDLQNQGRQIAGAVTQTQAQIQGAALQAQNTFNRFIG